jgi:hypothetical protein
VAVFLPLQWHAVVVGGDECVDCSLTCLGDVKMAPGSALLQRRKDRRRAVNARRSAWMELRLLKWIEWQVRAGLVKTREDALAKVGEMRGGISSLAVHNWKRGLVDFLGADMVGGELAKAANGHDDRCGILSQTLTQPDA